MGIWMRGVEIESWGKDGGTFTGGPPKGVLHTTEGGSWPGYEGGATAPHFTVLPNRVAGTIVVRQHTPVSLAARALMNEPGGVQTNRDSAIQVELVGSCDPKQQRSAMYYWPHADRKMLSALATFMRRLEAQCGIARRGIAPFLPYPASYGNRQGQRLSLSSWDNYCGWVGHQHVPENDHGDPGSLDIKALVTGAVINVPDVPPVTPPPSLSPKFPLAKGHYFGPKTGGASCESGYFGSDARRYLREWQARARQRRGITVSVDGLYGTQTRLAALAIQGGAHLTRDGLIGPATWTAAWAT